MRVRSPRPPAGARLLLKLRRLRDRRAEVETDLLDLYEQRARDRGRGHAAWRYWCDVLSLWRWRHDGPRDWEGFGIRGLTDDLRFAMRLFRRQPGAVTVTAVGLALAIGLGTAMFSLLNAVALRGPGVADPSSVYRLSVANLGFGPLTGPNSPTTGNWAAQDYEVLDRQARSVRVAAALGVPETMSLRTGGETERGELVPVTPVSGSYFPILGGTASAGRTLTRQDDRAEASPGAVVSHAFWRTRLAADPAVVGSTIWLDDSPFTIVGVARREFGGGLTPEPPAFWITLAAQAQLWRQRQDRLGRTTEQEIQRLSGARQLSPVERMRLEALRAELGAAPPRWNQPVDVVGRLSPDGSRDGAAAEVTTIAQGLAAARGQVADRVPSVQLQPADGDSGSRTRLTVVATTAVVIALLVFLACSNVANLLLANATGRRREIGTRLALGAGRGRVVRQLLTESVFLGAVGGVAGLVLAGWIAPLLGRVLGVPPLLDIDPDPRVYAFTVAMTLAAGLLAGLAPARYGRRGDLLNALQDRHAAGGAPGGRTRTVLIAAQAGGSLVLLVTAALFTRSLVQAVSFDLGFDADRLVSVSVPFGRGYDSSRRATYWDSALDRVRQVPGITGASLVALAPFEGAYAPHRLEDGRGPGRYVLRNDVTSDYFETAGIRLLRGRTFTPDEARSDAPVAIISASLARLYWKEEEPVGSTLDRVWGPPDPPDSRPRGLVRKPAGTRVVGVAADAITRLGSHDAPAIYLPLSSSAPARLVVGTQGDAAPAARQIEQALLALDPGLRPVAVPIREGLARELELPSAVAATAGVLSGTALALAAIGLFGVTAFVVGQRRHEISVRMALGATAGAILRMLVRDSLRPVVIGLAGGLGLALLAGRAMERVLFGVPGHDPLALGGAILVLMLASTAAVLVPASRAARVSPAEMLKQM